jgi:hypothetical protein
MPSERAIAFTLWEGTMVSKASVADHASRSRPIHPPDPEARAEPFNAPALTNRGDLPEVVLRGGGLIVGPVTLLVIVLFQAMLFAATFAAAALIIARPDLLQPLTAAWDRLGHEKIGPGTDGGTASPLALAIRQPIEVVAGQTSNLDFRLVSPGAYRGPVVLTIKGLPVGAEISGAHKLGADTWSLDASRELALSLKVPVSAQGPSELEVELHKPDGIRVAMETVTLIVRPEDRIGRDPEREAVGALLLLESARTFLQAGDAKSARLLFQSSAQRGNAQAALELGGTFDGVSVGPGDAAFDVPKAMYWYTEAKRLGHPEAEARLSGLIDKARRQERAAK